MNRKNILGLFLAALLGLVPAAAAWAQGQGDVFGRIVEMKGQVWVQGKPARVRTRVRLGDEVKTGRDSSAVIKLKDESALLLRADTSITIREQKKQGLIQMALGRMLAVFGEGDHEVDTPTAVAGVRGTALYSMIEDNGDVYFCVCFGHVDFRSNQDPLVEQSVSATHHHAIRFVSEGGRPAIVPAGMEDHTDQEVEHLKEVEAKPYSPWHWPWKKK